MATAYTPGLTISADTVVHKTRRLPIRGEVLISVNEPVEPDTIVARAELPGPITTVRLSDQLGVGANDLDEYMTKASGEPIEKGELLAKRQGFIKWFTTQVDAPVSGTIEFISNVTGNVGIRHQPTPVEVRSYLKGTATDLLEGEGATIETRGAMIQGIFGVGGEAHGQLAIIAKSPDEEVPPDRLSSSHTGKVVVCGALATYELLNAARRIGVIGLVAGGIVDAELKQLLGYDIGVAITGHEDIGLTVIVTEGFGALPMAQATFELLQSLEGRLACISGATQIRAGVIRPEVIVPRPELTGHTKPARSKVESGLLEIGTPIRIIREPNFGRLATVATLPPELQEVEAGAKVRVLEAELDNGKFVTVPRANVEIVETR